MNFDTTSTFSGSTLLNVTGTTSAGFDFISEPAILLSSGVCPSPIGPFQGVVPDPPVQSVAPSSFFTIDLDYSSSDPTTQGLGLDVSTTRASWFVDDSNMLQFGFVAHRPRARRQRRRRRISAPIGESGSPGPISPPDWPGTTDQRLVTLNFFTALGFSGSTRLNLTSSRHQCRFRLRLAAGNGGCLTVEQATKKTSISDRCCDSHSTRIR